MRINIKARARAVTPRLAACGLLVLGADVLFYRQGVGWTAGLFAVALLLAVWLFNRPRGAGRARGPAALAALACLGLALAMVEAPSLQAVGLYAVTLLALALLPRLAAVRDARGLALNVLHHGATGWIGALRDGTRLLRRAAPRRRPTTWLLPLLLGPVFIILFAIANPLIAHWLDSLLDALPTFMLRPDRCVLWLAVALACWPVLRPRPRRLLTWKDGAGDPAPGLRALFNPAAVQASLWLFNLIFLVPNLLDMAFLWRGAALPAGVSHAQYVHQGAYALIATALLAGLFVLIAFRPHGGVAPAAALRAGLLAWVGQNVFLVLSSMLRLLRYVEDYALTGWRVAAMIWMALVALGLLLILARILGRRTNRWLVNANALALYATLYLCCLPDFGALIANYNVRHCRQVTGHGAELDLAYLARIGPSSLPALIWLKTTHPTTLTPEAHHLRQTLTARLGWTQADWRQWTVRGWKLGRGE